MSATAYLHTRDSLSEQERERLILEHLPQVRLVARKIHGHLPDSIYLEDLLSAGVVGLITAIDNFDSSLNVKLKTYAEFRIRGAILDSLRETDWAPRRRRKQARDFEAAIACARQRLGRMPEEDEIARELHLTVGDYRRQLTWVEAVNIQELGSVNEDRQAPVILEYAAAPKDASPEVVLERAELTGLIAASIGRLPKAEKTVLVHYFYGELNLREIAQEMGIQISRVSQIKSQAILRLRVSMAGCWPGARS